MPPKVTEFPAAVAASLGPRDAIFFDGECVLCSGFFRFVLRHDRARHFGFATAQSPLGQQVYAALDLDGQDFQTNVVIVQGEVFFGLDSFAAVMGKLPMPWRMLRVLRGVPAWLKTPLYGAIARNRYRLFGRLDRCMMPDADTRDRFLRDGW